MVKFSTERALGLLPDDDAEDCERVGEFGRAVELSGGLVGVGVGAFDQRRPILSKKSDISVWGRKRRKRAVHGRPVASQTACFGPCGLILLWMRHHQPQIMACKHCFLNPEVAAPYFGLS